MSLEQQFADLFIGRLDAVGTEEGGALRYEPQARSPRHWWLDQIHKHLTGQAPVGVYPVTDGLVKWICIDWDEGEGDLVHAVNVQKVYTTFGAESWIERSRSKGFHLWVFLEEWCPIDVARACGLAACQIVDAPVKEINPKQWELDEDKLGNYVRLPYPGGLSNPNEVAYMGVPRRVVIGNPNVGGWVGSSPPEGGYPWPLGLLVEQASANLVPLSIIEQISDLYVPPPTVFAPLFVADTDSDMHARMTPLAKYIYSEGPMDGADRSSTFYKLGCLIKEGQLHTADEAYALLVEADHSWGKFHERRDGEKEIRRMVDKIWSTQ